jgi:hypothetical protein
MSVGHPLGRVTMTSDKARKTAVRGRMAETGEPYSVAARALDAQPIIYPDEQDMSREELGCRALPSDATPAQRARAEATWRSVSADRPCRCSGPCYHGKDCGDEDCCGSLLHIDRYPGSMLETTGWCDEYQCDCCDQPLH